MSIKISKSVKRTSVAYYKGCLISWEVFEEHVKQVRQKILKQVYNADVARHNPNVLNLSVLAPKVLNLCEDKYHFLVVFTACMLQGRITVMPANSSKGELARMKACNKNIQIINDLEISDICQHNQISDCAVLDQELNHIPNSTIVAELYSSGSTGEPRVNSKTWGQLINGAQQVYSSFNLTQPSIIATVQPQHMFGFEMSIVLVLVCGVTIHHEQPFYPLDIQRVLNEMPAPRVMITTPIHLKACTTLDAGWSDLAFVLSATAPMSQDVAEQAELIMQTQVREVYGCSEVGAIATRHLMKNSRWKLLPDYSLSIVNETAQLNVPARNNPIALPDQVEILSNNYFSLLGRNADLIKIGGKRGSLAQLTVCIKALPGVEDAIVFLPMREENQRLRLVALVVAPGKSSAQLSEILRHEIDPVFLPRPLYIVSQLPYNSTGKLPRADLLLSLDQSIKAEQSC